MCASRSQADNVRLRADIDRMLGLFPRADWVTQFMLQSSLSTDLGMLTSPLGMQAAVVAESVDHQQSSGSFSQRFLIVPAFGANGLSGGACVTQYSDRRHPLHEKALLKADVRIGRWIRDDATGEWLVLTRNDADNITRLMWIGSLKSTSRERICLTCMSDVFDTGDIERSVLFECSDSEFRVCPLCGAPPGACGGCALPVIRPRHPLDLSTSTESLVAVGGGIWSGNVQVKVFGQRGLVPSTTPFAHYCRHARNAQLARALQQIALTEKICSSTPPPGLSPIPADEMALWRGKYMAADSTDGISSSTSGSDGVAKIDTCKNDPLQPALPLDSLARNLPYISAEYSDTSAVLPAVPVNYAPLCLFATGGNGMGFGNAFCIGAKEIAIMEAEKKERTELRKVKNRLAAARSNARARDELEQKRNLIASNRTRIADLRQRHQALLDENKSLKSKVSESVQSASN